MKRIICISFITIVILCVGCGLIQRRLIPEINIEGADLVYYTLIDDPFRDGWEKDALGFYEIDTGRQWIIDMDRWLITPAHLSDNKFIALQKRGFPGSIYEYSGNVFIFTEHYYISCGKEGWGHNIHPYKGNILVDNKDGISIISGEDCSLINTVLTNEDLKAIHHSLSFGSYALSNNGNILILELWPSLVVIDLPSHERLFSMWKGKNPAISPDQKEIAYVSTDGIHIIDINGDRDQLLVNLVNYESYSSGGILPRPNWSSDSTKLIYHKLYY